MRTLSRWTPIVLLVLLAGSALGTVACSTTVPASVQVEDSSITAAVKSKLAADPDVAALNIDVDTNEGVVTLSGRVETLAEKSEAERLARETDGVRRVINNLRVGDQAG